MKLVKVGGLLIVTSKKTAYCDGIGTFEALHSKFPLNTALVSVTQLCFNGVPTSG
jgi:hypothetical protein